LASPSLGKKKNKVFGKLSKQFLTQTTTFKSRLIKKFLREKTGLVHGNLNAVPIHTYILSFH
jgi:hypothetical protein